MITFEPLDAPLGARVFGYDMSAPMSAEDVAAIKEGLKTYSVLVFRGHEQPSNPDLVTFAAQFGTLTKGSQYMEKHRENPEILHVGTFSDKDGQAAGAGGSYPIDWHSDYSFSPEPGITTFLEALVLPENPPRTSFLSQYDALATLDAGTRERIRKLRLFHSTANYGKKDSYGGPEMSGRKDEERLKLDVERDRARGVTERPKVPEAEHPMIVRHPETGRESLYISPALVERVIGLPEEEGEALMRQLYDHVNRPERIYAYDWQVGDLVMFDTLGTLHARDAWDSKEDRHMRQMTTIAPLH